MSIAAPGRRLNIVYRGNFQPTVPAETRWSTEHQIALTLESLGHRVVRAQEDDPQWGWDRVVAEAADADADLFLWTQTWNVDPDGGYRALDDLRALGVVTASYHLDLYWGTLRAAQMLEYPFWRTDHVFTPDGGHDDGFRRNGINHHWAEPAIYEPDARAGTADPNHTWPVVFVGSFPYPHPEHAAQRREIVMQCQSRYPGRFRVYRGGWRGQALADLYASATVVVGDSCLAGRVHGYWSDRIPETVGRAGFLVHPHVPGIEGSYTDGEHLRLYEPGDMGHMTALIDHYLRNPHEAREIGRRGQRHVQARHTYRHRMEAMLEAVGLADREPAGV